jgi:hypothetical protein
MTPERPAPPRQGADAPLQRFAIEQSAKRLHGLIHPFSSMQVLLGLDGNVT